MGQPIFQKGPDGEGRQNAPVYSLGEMVVHRGDPGKEALIPAEKVQFFPGELRPLGKGA
jgi:hypothetical protein